MTEASRTIVGGERVVLRSFNGAKQAPADEQQDIQNKYWRLIGHYGLVVRDVPDRHIDANRVLVQFDVDVVGLGLHCHNEIPNSLWIRRDDLERAFEGIDRSIGGEPIEL